MNIISRATDPKNKSLIEIHIAVLFFGLAGIFGKLINLPPLVIVFGRVLSAACFLGIIMTIKQQSIKLESKKEYKYFVLLGMILAFHWVAFFKSIQLSTVAIGLLMFSTFPVFVTFLEPIFLKEKISIKNIIIAGITFSGVVVVMPNFQFQNTMTQGALWGIMAGFSFAVLSVLNKKFVAKHNSMVISFYQTSVATIVLLPFVLNIRPEFGMKNIALLIVLGVIFTGIAHTLFINGMKHVKAQTASIIASLEPVYGIIATALLLKEIPNIRELIGGTIILGTASYSTLTTKDE